MKVFERKVAWVSGGGQGLGRDVALRVAARGAHVLVTGPEERSLGESVGEIVFGGGKARHRVVAAGDGAGLADAAAHARTVFGGLHLAFGAPADEASIRRAAGPDVPFVALTGDDADGLVAAAAARLG